MDGRKIHVACIDARYFLSLRLEYQAQDICDSEGSCDISRAEPRVKDRLYSEGGNLAPIFFSLARYYLANDKICKIPERSVVM